VTDADQLRLEADLIGVMRAAASSAVANGAAFVAPAHVVLGLLADARIGPVVAPLIPREHVESAAAASGKLPDVAEVPEGAIPEGEHPPFARRDTIAFLTRDGKLSMYLDADAFHLYLEGARRARGAYDAKNLVHALIAEAVKEQTLMALIGSEPQRIGAAIDAL